MTAPLRVLTWNIHKGMSPLGTSLQLDAMRSALRTSHADLVFLQEVVGRREAHARPDGWPDTTQFEHLADGVWSHHAYARNAITSKGHHGNALLSRHPIAVAAHTNLSTNALEQRGLLHAMIDVEDGRRLHALCVHLGLTQRGRDAQVAMLAEHIARRCGVHDPVILAGDFNDWRGKASGPLHRDCGMLEAHEAFHGSRARTFPAAWPLLGTDRIYVRGLDVEDAHVLRGGPYASLSDHAPVLATLALRLPGANFRSGKHP